MIGPRMSVMPSPSGSTVMPSSHAAHLLSSRPWMRISYQEPFGGEGVLRFIV